MIDPEVQPLRIKIDCSYDARLFEGDPADSFEIADLEKEAIEEIVRNSIENILGTSVRNFNLRVQPE